MIRSEDEATPREDVLDHAPGLLVFTEVEQSARQGLSRVQGVGVVGAEGTAAAFEDVLGDASGLGVVTEVAHGEAEELGAGEDVRVVRAVDGGPGGVQAAGQVVGRARLTALDQVVECLEYGAAQLRVLGGGVLECDEVGGESGPLGPGRGVPGSPGSTVARIVLTSALIRALSAVGVWSRRMAWVSRCTWKVP